MMRKVVQAWLVSALVLLSLPGGALALPPDPYSPFGTVQINGEWVEDGTMVRAYCSGVEYGSSSTQFIKGASRYSIINVQGDDPDTPEVDGCLDGETVTFTVDGWTADQTGTWVEYTSVEINLTAFRPEPALDLEKHTQSEDADAAPGPHLRAGETVTWTYAIANTGNVPLTSLTLTDDVQGTVTCPQTTLAVDETITCTLSATAQPGQYANLGTATAYYESTQVQASDPSHYFGENPVIDLEKATNGQDADSIPGVVLPAGDALTWTFTVSNNGNVNLTGIAVADDVLGPVSCPLDSLDAGEEMTCEVTGGVAASGQHTNTASVIATPPLGPDVGDSDSSHYFGAVPAVTMDKLTDGVDADTAPGPFARTGQTVTWSYVVTNTGNITLTMVSVMDDQGVTVTCPDEPLASADAFICTASASAIAGPYTNLGIANGTPLAGDVVSATDRSHYFGANPSIDVEKRTNGQNADSPPGPIIRVGNPITWTYAITNTGNITLTNVTLTDSDLGSITCSTTQLASNEAMTCETTGTATAGQYQNEVTVTGTPPVGDDVSDSDPSHYFGADPSLRIEKATNGEDADNVPGVFVLAGHPVTWTFAITNTGNITLTNVTLTDSDLGLISCPQSTLSWDESMVCEATGTAVTGPYANVATVTGAPPVGSNVEASDSSHYYGITPSLTVEKWTNGQDADSPPGPIIRVGNPITWTYAITNTGNITLTNVTLTDSDLGSITCSATQLAPDEAMTCEAAGTATAGQYQNEVTVTGTPPVGDDVSDSDPSHYFGADPSLRIEKATNGEDADNVPGVLVLAGHAVTWTFAITNTGNITLTNVTLTDSDLGLISCPQSTLSWDESMVCEATGTAVTGPYANVATVTGAPPVGDDVSDSDSSHYFGGDPSIAVEKFTNGEAAASAPGPFILVGHPVTWTYVVTNTGNIELTGISVVDDQGVSVSCPQAVLQAGEGMTCQAVGTAVEGQYMNNATASGMGTVGPTVNDVAVSHYFGADPGITVTKYTKGLDITAPPGPILPATTAVTWTYTVTNTGNVTLTAVTVTDDQLVTVDCPQSTLLQDESMVCSAEDLATPGQYTNVGTASGTPPGNLAAIFAHDTSYYFGFAPNPEISLRKRVNGIAANTAPGLYIEVGDAITWTFDIANTGNLTVTNVVITDDLGTPANPADDVVVCTVPELGLYTTERCELSGSAIAGQYANRAVASGLPTVGDLVTATDVSYYYGSDPGIDLEKHTNGHDADTGTGPLIRQGDAVTWTFAITNTGNVTLNPVSVSDDVLGSIACPQTSLAPAEPMTCTVTGSAAPGQYANTGTVVGTPPVGARVSDSDPSHYYGTAPAVTLQKSTNGQPGENVPGVFVLAGHAVTWTYAIANAGNVVLSNISLVDSQEGPVTCPATNLAVGTSMTCTLTGTVQPGQYTNAATVTAQAPLGDVLSQSDTSHYFGVTASITLTKTTNNLHALTPPGPFILVGETVTWQYTVTNTSNITLTNVMVTDDQGVEVSCPQTELGIGEVMVCEGSDAAIAGQYRNEATVTSLSPVGTHVSATAVNYYFGVGPGIRLSVATNGQDADAPPGPVVMVGDGITWTYTVTNTGNSELENVSVMDAVLGPVPCPTNTLAAEAHMVCEVTGVAAPGQYANLGTASGTPPAGDNVSDDDPSHYVGAVPDISLALDLSADDGQTWVSVPAFPPTTILASTPVTLRVTLSNTGNITLTALQLSSVDVDLTAYALPSGLATATSDACIVPLPWASGNQQVAVSDSGEVVDYTGTAHPVTADASLRYFGAAPSIIVAKDVSPDGGTTWLPADAVPGPSLLSTVTPSFRVVVTNTGNITLTALTLEDSALSLSACAVPPLAQGGAYSCTVTGVWEPGQHQSTVTATATFTDVFGTVAAPQSENSVHYFGVQTGLHAEKNVSVDGVTWVDADEESSALDVTPGAALWWRIAVTNTSNTTLAVNLVDIHETHSIDLDAVCLPPPPAILAPAEIYQCTYSGVASAETGIYRNVLRAEGRFDGELVSEDTDAAHYAVTQVKVYIPVVLRLGDK